MITIAGEALIDLVVDRSGSVAAFPGGGPFNVARMAGRLGARCQFVGRLGDDAFGRRLRAELERAGVGLAIAQPTAAPTTLAIAELDEAGAAEYRFHLEGTSAAMLERSQIPSGVLDGAVGLALGGLALIVEPTASTLVGLVESAPQDSLVLVDPNCRPSALADPASYPAAVERFLARADIVKCSVEDLAVLVPGASAGAAARKLLDAGPAAVIVTAGASPVTVITPDHGRTVPVAEVDVVDTVGAGDGFVAGLLAWWARNSYSRRHAADVDLVAEGAQAAVAVASAACTVAGADLPAGFGWPQAAPGDR